MHSSHSEPAEGRTPDRKVVGRARSGDQAAWFDLVGQHQEAIFRLAYLLLRDADEAEDVAQEVFIRAFHAMDQFDDTRPLRPWLLQITKNLAYNRQRSVRRYVSALRKWFDTTPKIAPDVALAHARSDDAILLHRAIERLRRSDQEVIYLRYFLELSVDESASVLGVASGTIKSRLSRALVRLQGVVEQEFPMLQEERAE